MRKSIITIVLVGLMIPNVILGQDIKLVINNQQVKTEVAPLKQEGTTVVPLKIIATELGAKVNFDNNNQKVTVVKDNKFIELPIGKKIAIVNGEQYELRTPAKIINGITMVPVRFIADHLDCSTGWDYKNNTVLIKSNDITEGEEENKEANKEDEADNKNIYTSEFLQKLVDTTPCNEVILEFRKQYNPRRDGLLKQEGKYFDIYYPNNNYAKEVAGFLAPHMDKAYMMLTDLYGIQAKVEVHLINEEDTIGLKEGEVRVKENVTYVWLEKNSDGGGNNLAEIIHEMNHNFFSQVNGKANNTRWIEEVISKQVASLYTQFNYQGEVEQWEFQDFEKDSKNMNDYLEKYRINFQSIQQYFGNTKNDGWGYRKDGKEKAIQQYAIYIGSFIYNKNDLDTFKYFLRNQAQQGGTTFEAISRSLKVDINDLESEIEKYIYSSN